MTKSTRQRLERIEAAISTLEHKVCHATLYTPRNPFHGQYPDLYTGVLQVLRASDIIDRFDELYNHLGVRREISPQKMELKKI